MVAKKKDLRDVEQRQSNVGNPKEQEENMQDITGNDIQNIKPPNLLLEQKAEEYLREKANIEDMPNEKDQEDYEKTIENNEKK
jgi:hypothetical protein